MDDDDDESLLQELQIEHKSRRCLQPGDSETYFRSALHFTRLPFGFEAVFSNIRYLNLRGRGLCELPDQLNTLPLWRLDVRQNALQALPESIRRMPGLRRVDVADNPLCSEEQAAKAADTFAMPHRAVIPLLSEQCELVLKRVSKTQPEVEELAQLHCRLPGHVAHMLQRPLHVCGECGRKHVRPYATLVRYETVSTRRLPLAWHLCRPSCVRTRLETWALDDQLSAEKRELRRRRFGCDAASAIVPTTADQLTAQFRHLLL